MYSEAELLRPLPRKREVRLNVTVRYIAPTSSAPPSFAELYGRATTIVEARIGALRCEDRTAVPRNWILAQAWFVNEVGATSIYSASITSAASFLEEHTVVPLGEPRPDAGALRVPSGGTPEAFEAKHLNDQGSRHLDEIYVDFDDADRARDVTVSYGEYVATCDGVDHGPIVERAERRARLCHQTLSVSDGEMNICPLTFFVASGHVCQRVRPSIAQSPRFTSISEFRAWVTAKECTEQGGC